MAQPRAMVTDRYAKLGMIGAIVAIGVAMQLAGAQASLDFTRVHLVDSGTSPNGQSNWLFRGNMPTNDTTTPHTFALDTLLGYMRQRAAQHGVTLPAQLYLIDISLNNPFDGDYSVEQDFWKSAPASVGKLLPWPLGLAGILPPSVYNESERREMANASVWKVDKIPERIADIRTMLHTDWPVPAVIYVHCSAGCDRTGEVIGSYRMRYNTSSEFNLKQMYAMDTAECGRSPNYYSTSALEWFCYYMVDQGVSEGNCTNFATCKFLGSCTPSGDDDERMEDAEASDLVLRLRGGGAL